MPINFDLSELAASQRTKPTCVLLNEEVVAIMAARANKPAAQPAAEATPPQKEYAQHLEEFVTRNLSTIDDNHDNFLSRAELKLYALRPDIAEHDREMAKAIVANYDDLNRLVEVKPAPTTMFVSQFDNLHTKSKPELSLTDLAMLRLASDAESRKNAVKQKQREGFFADYFSACLLVGAESATAGAALGLMTPPKVRATMILGGAAVGIIAGAAFTYYGRNYIRMPGCQNYYDRKQDLSATILNNMAK